MSIITALWRSQQGEYFCISTRSPWRDHFFRRDELDEVDSFIADNKKKDIYFCPRGFTKPRRKVEYLAPTSLLWDDLDEVDPRSLNGSRPTIAIESSPGRYAGVWQTDGATSSDLNRRLSYKHGAGPGGGWDDTQVLRVPGTINHKYETEPKVRLLWSNGPTYKLAMLEKFAPPDKTSSRSDGGDAAGILKKYEKRLPIWCRRELVSGKPKRGVRSDMLWKLGNTLIECGVSREEAFVLLRASAWNKFKGRDDQLRRELDKAVSGHLTHETSEDKPAERSGRLSTSMADVEEKSLSWIWYPYLARGELTIIEGDPGLGKSYLAQMVASSICDGKALPSSRSRKTKGKVAYFDLENSGATVTKPRLVDNNIAHPENFYKDEEPFSVDDEDECEEVLEALERLKPVLVVFDTVNTYIGKADTGNAAQSTQAMQFFRDVAVRFNCAVIVIRHLTKSTKEKALYRGQGSIAFTGLARIVVTIGLDPDDGETRIIGMTKNNFTRPAKLLAYYITELPATLQREDRSRFKWGEWREDLNVEDILTVTPSSGNSETADFLREALEDGPQEYANLKRMAEARGISHMKLYRTADALGVIRKVTGFGKDKTSVWTLSARKTSSRGDE